MENLIITLSFSFVFLVAYIWMSERKIDVLYLIIILLICGVVAVNLPIETKLKQSETNGKR